MMFLRSLWMYIHACGLDACVMVILTICIKVRQLTTYSTICCWWWWYSEKYFLFSIQKELKSQLNLIEYFLVQQNKTRESTACLLSSFLFPEKKLNKYLFLYPSHHITFSMNNVKHIIFVVWPHPQSFSISFDVMIIIAFWTSWKEGNWIFLRMLSGGVMFSSCCLSRLFFSQRLILILTGIR